jgi:hypothetical protein
MTEIVEGSKAAATPLVEDPKVKAAAEYWFARRFPVGHERKSMGPVNWKGWAAFGAFTLALIGGGMAFMLMAIWDSVLMGLFAFAFVAFTATMALLKIVSMKGDQTRTMEDYMKAGRDVAH